MPGQGVQVHEVEGVVLLGDDDGAFVDWSADFEADAIISEEDELGGVPYMQHLRVMLTVICYLRTYET